MLHRTVIFSTLYLIRAYHQIRVAEEDIPKTAIITLWDSMNFRNTAQTFQRFIDKVPHRLNFAYAYFHDVPIASTTAEEHENWYINIFVIVQWSFCVFKWTQHFCHFIKQQRMLLLQPNLLS
jgi:hypothetical protein